MVDPIGFEPMTAGRIIRGSPRLSYRLFTLIRVIRDPMFSKTNVANRIIDVTLFAAICIPSTTAQYTKDTIIKIIIPMSSPEFFS